MSSITNSLFGGSIGGVGSGMGFRADGANIQMPTTNAQANTAYDQQQQSLQQQLAFLQAVQGQNGLGNQSSVFNQLQGVANGTGPNPAQAMLNQSTGANVANQAALMAGQRGSSANPGLIARQAAQQGAGIQQQAAGQGATMQANQSLNALGQMSGLATNQANQQAQATQNYGNQALAGQQNILGGIAGQNNANVGMQSNINSTNGALANTVAKQQGDMFGNVAKGAGTAILGMFADGGEVPDVGMPPAPAQQPAMTGTTPLPQANNGPTSNIGKFFKSAISGSIPDKASGSPNDDKPSALSEGSNKMGEALGAGIKSLFGGSNAAPGVTDPNSYAAQFAPQQSPGNYGAVQGGLSEDAMDILGNAGEALALANGGPVPALVSPGEQYLPPKDVKKVLKEGKSPLSVGEKIPGKPKHPGNDYRNDTVKKTLQSGGVVIPNEIMQGPSPAWNSMKFVHAHMAKQRKSLPKKSE